MKLFQERQVQPIVSEVTALISVVRPIFLGTLYGLKLDIVKELQGYENVKLKMLPRLYRPGCGDIGICFEWAVHDAIQQSNPLIMERIVDAARMCKLQGQAFNSILFGLEKSGRAKILDTVEEVLTDDSRILTGARAQPPKLKVYMNMLSTAFSRPNTRKALPYSINGLWKADLFFGATDSDRWIGTTMKINPSQLEGARGLRIGIVPASQGKSDTIKKDDKKNLIICPLPYDGSFMELFYTGWRIVQQFISADAHVPKEAALPNPPERQVARELEMRRDFCVIEVVEVLEAQSQRDLIEREERKIKESIQKDGSSDFNDTLVAPVPLIDFD